MSSSSLLWAGLPRREACPIRSFLSPCWECSFVSPPPSSNLGIGRTLEMAPILGGVFLQFS
jgi:hypothetical protein